jgi:hypothetical protein
MKYSREEIRKVYKSMPDVVKDVLGSIENAEVMETIGKKHNLHIDQQGALVDEITLLILGMTKIGDFPNALSAELHVPDNVAQKITADVNAQIFHPLREQLRQSLEAPKEIGLESKPVEEQIQSQLEPVEIGHANYELPSIEKYQKQAAAEADSEIEESAEEVAPPKPADDTERHVGLTEAKLAGTMKLPKEEHVEEETPRKPQYPGGSDPYREPPV